MPRGARPRAESLLHMSGHVARFRREGDGHRGQIRQLENQDILNQVEQARLELEKAEIALAQAQAGRGQAGDGPAQP